MFTIAGPIAAPSIAAVMSVFAKLAQTGLVGTGLLLEAFTSKLNKQVIPKLDPKSIDIAWNAPLLLFPYIQCSPMFTTNIQIKRSPFWRDWEGPLLLAQELCTPVPWCSERAPTRTWKLQILIFTSPSGFYLWSPNTTHHYHISSPGVNLISPGK